jgi:hypothetical protein
MGTTPPTERSSNPEMDCPASSGLRERSASQRDGHEGRRTRTANSRYMTSAVDVFDQRDHSRRKASPFSVGCLDLDLAFKHHDELPARRWVRFGLTDFWWRRHEHDASGWDSSGDQQRRHIRGVGNLALSDFDFLDRRTPVSVVGDLRVLHEGILPEASGRRPVSYGRECSESELWRMSTMEGSTNHESALAVSARQRGVRERCSAPRDARNSATPSL